jgi:hypothetical protein
MTDIIVCKSSHNGCTQTETSTKAAGNVVFPPAFPSLERPGGANTPRSGVKTKHDLTEGETVIFTGIGRTDIEDAHYEQ